MPQLVWVHGVVGPAQDDDAHTQSAHAPLIGPVADPTRQSPLVAPDRHQPHELAETQPLQVVPLQVVPLPVQEPTNHRQSVQLPVVGPEEVPDAQADVEAHQPQVGPVRQPSQPLDIAHGSVPEEPEEQTPPSQVRPAQQSAEVVQLWLPVRQAHRPETQRIWPQQSRSPVQVWLDSAQQACVTGIPRQLRPGQQLAAAVHAVCATPHIGLGGGPESGPASAPGVVPRRHTPPVQDSPVRQAVAPLQQAAPSPPQSGSQALAVQRVAHVIPHPPQ